MSTEDLHYNKKAWKTAMDDAQAEIERAKGRIRRLREAIRIFRKNMEAGEPWPKKESNASTHN